MIAINSSAHLLGVAHHGFFQSGRFFNQRLGDEGCGIAGFGLAIPHHPGVAYRQIKRVDRVLRRRKCFKAFIPIST